MKKRLKDEEILVAKITIREMRATYKDKNYYKGKTIGYLIDVDRGYSKTMFREDDAEKVWENIKKEVFLQKKDEELTYSEYMAQGSLKVVNNTDEESE